MRSIARISASVVLDLIFIFSSPYGGLTDRLLFDYLDVLRLFLFTLFQLFYKAAKLLAKTSENRALLPVF